MASEEDQGREQPPLYRGGKNVTPKERPPLNPTAPKHSEEDDDEKPKRLKDVYKKTRLAGEVITMEQGKKNVEDAKKAQTRKTLQRVLEMKPDGKS